MKFQVPQFIETETKIIGPFTLKQFLFVAGGASAAAFEYMTLKGNLFLFAVVPTIAFFGALAFAKINGAPFLNWLAYLLAFLFASKRYTYHTGKAQEQYVPKQP